MVYKESKTMEGKPFSLLIKPASADCNLCCDYCFYLCKRDLYPEAKKHRMAESLLERLISSYMATSQPVYCFGWQGGEPTLMGADFFRKVVELQQGYGRAGAVISNGLQTNATLIDEDLAALFSEYRFLIGISIDGPKAIHDHYRRKPSRKGSHKAALAGMDLLRRYGVEFNALVVVNAANVGRAKQLYYYLRGLGINHHQYIPCTEFDAKGRLLPYSITGRQ